MAKTIDYRVLYILGTRIGGYEMGEGKSPRSGRRGSQTPVFLFSAPFPGAQPLTSGWVWRRAWGIRLTSCVAQEDF